TMVPLSEVTRVHIRHQSVQGILVGLLLGTALTALLLGTLRRDPLHLLLGISAALFALSGLTGVGWALHNWSFLHGQTGNLLSLAGIIVLCAGLLGASPRPGSTGSRAERIIILVHGTLSLSISIAQPAGIQMVHSGRRIVLPGLMLVLIAVALVRRNPVDPLFTAGTLLLTSSWLLEQLLGLPPHGITQHLTDLLLWASLLCYS